MGNVDFSFGLESQANLCLCLAQRLAGPDFLSPGPRRSVVDDDSLITFSAGTVSSRRRWKVEDSWVGCMRNRTGFGFCGDGSVTLMFQFKVLYWHRFCGVGDLVGTDFPAD